tara:strand:+ start:282 stop:719 length:438 start_codon:yes stop_codon:yes gene_type:complete
MNTNQETEYDHDNIAPPRDCALKINPLTIKAQRNPYSKLKTNLQQRDMLEIALTEFGCEIPLGLGELPLCWAEPIVEFIHDSTWALNLEMSTKVELGWKFSKSEKLFLEITFAKQIKKRSINWFRTAPVIIKLNRRMNSVDWRQL